MKKFFFPIFIFICIFIVYAVTSAGKTPYDYFTRLSASFLHGIYWLTQNPPWLNELIPAGANIFYVVYPPMPAIIAIPFVFIFKEGFQQQILAHLMGAGMVILMMRISKLIKNDNKLTVWTGLLTGFGTIIWFLSSNGSSWYLGQVSAAFFLTAALAEGLGKKRPFLVGLLLGSAFLSRLQTILTFPLFLYLLKEKNWLKKYISFGLGVLPFILFNFIYNYLRFGVIWDKGYSLIPRVLSESWYQKGIFNLSYIPRHLKIILTALPIFKKTFPYILPSWGGLAIWITTPAFIYSIFANIKEKIVRYSWLCIALISILIFSHGTTGFAQFGYRFAVDFYPLLIFLTIKGVAKTGLRWHHWLLLFLSILVNLWGVIWINKMGWISF